MSATCERMPVEPVLQILAARGRSLKSLGPNWSRLIARAKAGDGLTWMSADRVAVELLELHPANVWPDQW